MKKYQLVTVALLLTLSTQLHATNGANLIGLTPASIAMGGVGIAYDSGVESIVKNPALITRLRLPTLLMGANIAGVDLKSRVTYAGIPLTTDTGFAKNNLSTFYIPEIGYVMPLSENFSVGLGLFGTAGFGIDHRNQTQGSGVLSNMQAFVLALKLTPSIAYRQGPLGLGLSNHITYGLLSFGASLPDQTGNPSTTQQRGSGIADALSGGIQGGISYDINDNITLGATYQTPVTLAFRRAFDFDRNGVYDDITIELPAELGVGVDTTFDRFHVALDVKQIYWSKAKFFKSLNWRNQTVVALGTQYQANDQWVLRLGYNYARSMIKDGNNLNALNGTTNLGGAEFFDSTIAFFNLVGLGGVIGEQTITAGTAYAFTPHFKLDVSAAYGLPKTITQTGKTSLAGANDTDATYTAKVSTFITTAALIFQF